MGLNYCRLHL